MKPSTDSFLWFSFKLHHHAILGLTCLPLESTWRTKCPPFLSQMSSISVTNVLHCCHKCPPLLAQMSSIADTNVLHRCYKCTPSLLQMSSIAVTDVLHCCHKCPPLLSVFISLLPANKWSVLVKKPRNTDR